MNYYVRFPLWLSCFLLAGVFIMTGCKTSVESVDIVASPDSLELDQSGTFEAAASPEDASQPVMYRWNFGDNNTGEGNTVTHSYSDPGTYTVEVTASNRGGKGTATQQTSVVAYRPPVPAEIVTMSADPTDPDTRTSVRFSANVRGDTPLDHSWDFGDGSSGSGSSPTHTYGEPGTYTVSLEASNNAGSDSRTMSITVSVYEADYCAELTEMNPAFFDRNSSVLTAEARSQLEDNVEIFNDCPNLNVRVEGLAGPFERNPQQLSDDRARAVEQFYTDNGVAASRITASGQGRSGEGSKKSGAEQFRRVDTIPLP